jgi:two-component system, NarL family, nitrate/nitrite response regulator NarL
MLVSPLPDDRPALARVLLVDDQPLFRRAIATLIEEQPDFTVIAEASNGQEALDRARELRPDLVVMDVEMPVLNGVEAVRLLRDEMAHIKVVMLTVSEDEDYLFDAIRYGANGFLLKDLQPEQLYEMLRSVLRGESPISPVMAGRLLAEFRRSHAEIDGAARPAGAQADLGPDTQRSHLPPRFTAPPAPAAELDAMDLARFPLASAAAQILTRRELETLQYVADGLSNKEIGQKLSITEGTVKNHVHNALEKLQLDNRIQAAAYVVRQGIAHAPARS